MKLTYNKLRELIESGEHHIVVVEDFDGSKTKHDLKYNNTCKKTDWNERFFNSVKSITVVDNKTENK